MSRIISFIGAKGGTLKTASAAAVAHVFAKAGLRVVMVDLDPQGDLTTRSNFRRVPEPVAAEPVLVGYEGEPELPLWLLRGGRSMEGVDLNTVKRHVGRACSLNSDLVVVDTPPALGPATRTAARTAHYIIILAEPGKEGLLRAHDVISIATEDGHTPIVRILLTKAKIHTNLYCWMVDNVDELYPELRSPIVIPHETAAAESAVFNRPVTISAPRSRSARAYRDIADDVIRQLGLEQHELATGGRA